MATLLGGSLAGQPVTIAAGVHPHPAVFARGVRPPGNVRPRHRHRSRARHRQIRAGTHAAEGRRGRARPLRSRPTRRGHHGLRRSLFSRHCRPRGCPLRYDLEHWTAVAYALPLFCAFAAHSRLLEYWHHRNADAGKVATAQALACWRPKGCWPWRVRCPPPASFGARPSASASVGA